MIEKEARNESNRQQWDKRFSASRSAKYKRNKGTTPNRKKPRDEFLASVGQQIQKLTLPGGINVFFISTIPGHS